MRLTLLRHGQTEHNLAGLWQGHTDSALTERGVAQARALAEAGTLGSFDAVYSSDLGRAIHTARLVGFEPDQDPTWREIGLGTWEGLTRDEVLRRFPEQARAVMAGKDLRIGGGESWSDVQRRLMAGVAALRERHAGDAVLVVSHGGAVLTLTTALLGRDTQWPRVLSRVTNTAVSRVDLSGSEPRLLSFNDASHLSDGQVWQQNLSDGKAVLRLRCDGPERNPADLEARLAAAPRGELVEVSLSARSLTAWGRTWLGARLGEAEAGRIAQVAVDGDERTLVSWNVSPPANA